MARPARPSSTKPIWRGPQPISRSHLRTHLADPTFGTQITGYTTAAGVWP